MSFVCSKPSNDFNLYLHSQILTCHFTPPSFVQLFSLFFRPAHFWFFRPGRKGYDLKIEVGSIEKEDFQISPRFKKREIRENKKRGCAEEGAAGLGEQVILPLKVFMVHLVIIHARHIYSVGFFSKHDLSAR
jgi:hypothetical protein